MLQQIFEDFIYNTTNLSAMGFLETRASLLIDYLIFFIAMLPIFIPITIFLAKKGQVGIHQFFQVILFLLTLLALVLLGYTIHIEEGYELLLTKSTIPLNIAYVILGVHILVATIMLFKWFFTMIYAISDRSRKALPGLYSDAHISAGKVTFILIFFMVITTIANYWVLFVA